METSYYESGNIEYEVEIIDGLLQGKQTFYFDSPDKLISAENFYDNGTSVSYTHLTLPTN